jgi:hypothetical protein
MADGFRHDMRTDVTGSGDGPLARKPFQFTLRTMFLVMFVVALFCSAAATFDGMARILAFTAILWLVVGAKCLKMRAAGSTLVTYFGGPMYGVILWAGSACRGSVWRHEGATLFAVAFFAGAVLAVSLVWLRRRW